MTSEGQGFQSTADAAVCVCGHGKGDHRKLLKWPHAGSCRFCSCIWFRTEDPRILNVALFNEYCEHPEKHGGMTPGVRYYP
jgi:hypothetical protein